MSEKRVMIIVWKWMDLKQQQIDWDEVAIKEQESDKIIRMLEKKSKKSKEKILQFIDQNKDATIFLFLHRDHNYNSDDVKGILHQIHGKFGDGTLVKAFLFEGPRDFIYYGTQNEGLLDQIGNFMIEDEYTYTYEDETGKKFTVTEEVAVAEKNEETGKWEVFPKHFNRVWRHYEHEFKKKIDSLHLDLMSFLVEIPTDCGNKKPYPLEYWYEQIKGNIHLYARVKSFFDLYKDSELEKLEPNERKKAIEEYEKLKEMELAKQESLSFDDCNANLMEIEEASPHYVRLNERFSPSLINNESSNHEISLNELHELFKKLAKSLPE